jgi:NagD protein
MMRHTLKKIGCTREETIVIGDRMDTDVVAGIDTLLVSGVTSRAEMDNFPYRPTYVFNGVGDIIESRSAAP